MFFKTVQYNYTVFEHQFDIMVECELFSIST